MRMIGFGRGFGLALSLVLVSRGSAQTSACQTNADTSAIYMGTVRRTLTLGDSARLISQGLPYQPTSVTLVTSNQTCSKAVTAYNSTLPTGDPRRITKAYVMKVGNSVYAVVGRSSPAALTVLYYDTKFKWLAGISDMN